MDLVMHKLLNAVMRAALANMPNGPSHKEYPEQRAAREAVADTRSERERWNDELAARKRQKGRRA